MDEKDYDSLGSHEKFRFPDYRELEREDFIKLINQALKETSFLIFASDSVSDKRPSELVLLIRLLALLISGRVSIDGVPISLVHKEKKDEK
jgi:hypothetical protein